MQTPKTLIIATEGITTNLLYEQLNGLSEVVQVIIEEKESRKDVILRRVKKLGWIKTLGQVAFLSLILPLIPSRKKRINEILAKANLKEGTIPEHVLTRIDSVHNEKLVQLVLAHQPDIVFINGTRILRKNLLHAIKCPIINIHVGITPKYRGVHGGYWAIRNNDPTLFGVTLHYVDQGIDTGNIIAQQVIKVDNQDNFKTYPILQYSAGIKLIQQNIEAIAENRVEIKPSLTEESRLHYHPTIWQFIFGKK